MLVLSMDKQKNIIGIYMVGATGKIPNFSYHLFE